MESLYELLRQVNTLLSYFQFSDFPNWEKSLNDARDVSNPVSMETTTRLAVALHGFLKDAESRRLDAEMARRILDLANKLEEITTVDIAEYETTQRDLVSEAEQLASRLLAKGLSEGADMIGKKNYIFGATGSEVYGGLRLRLLRLRAANMQLDSEDLATVDGLIEELNELLGSGLPPPRDLWP